MDLRLVMVGEEVVLSSPWPIFKVYWGGGCPNIDGLG